MTPIPDYLTPEVWLSKFFGAATVKKGGVLKRQVRDVERLVGRERFLRAVERNGFQAVENNGSFVVFCNGLPLKRVRSQRAADEAAAVRAARVVRPIVTRVSVETGAVDRAP